jgi:hypothetical protein
MRLITEVNEQIKFVTEAREDGKKSMYIEGVYMQSERPNRNGRMYRFETLNREAQRYITEYVQKGRAFGELGHPQGPTINLERSAILIKDLRAEGTDFYGKAKVLDTPYGNIVKNLIDEGGQLGVSTRGMGSLKEGKDGIKIVEDDFYLATAADVVADPSAPDAFVRGIMESREWVYVNGIWMEQQIDAAKSVIKKATSKELAEAKIRVFKSFINSL